MPYVWRNDDGSINGLFANAQEFAKEFLEDGDSEVVACIAAAQTESEPVASDKLMQSIDAAGFTPAQLAAVKALVDALLPGR